MRAVLLICEFALSVMIGSVMVCPAWFGDFGLAAMLFAALLFMLSTVTVSEMSTTACEAGRSRWVRDELG